MSLNILGGSMFQYESRQPQNSMSIVIIYLRVSPEILMTLCGYILSKAGSGKKMSIFDKKPLSKNGANS